MDPVSVIANAAHEYSDTLPSTSQDRALLFSRRYGFAKAALDALHRSGYVVVRKETFDALAAEVAFEPETPHVLAKEGQ